MKFKVLKNKEKQIVIEKVKKDVRKKDKKSKN